ncbi:hypothetical protein ETU08_01875 [Apibacter muscae]|uniref:Uncharacterized protein n=1 Tax=Apibacter muscae TaxID=2509004 RepID=A0A563DKY1_9FLAO|nr:hypothetical protein [Apibacter muscae]TWP30533.1 hypothetical protein ETU09_00600 [Apibacter muscae]TWP31254.1 hypothetical protein ETU08_01875 [Apibacter muscae]
MNQFKDFKIKPEINHFTGDKIKIDKILNVPIVIIDYKIEQSKAKVGTQLLTLQIEKSGTRHVVFTGSTVLLQMIQKVDKEKFPFISTIVKENEYLEFT